MGNTDSKATGEGAEDVAVTSIPSKEESNFTQFSSPSGMSSYEGAVEEQSSYVEEKKNIDISADTPRVNTSARSNGRSKKKNRKNRKSSVQARDDEHYEVTSSHISDDQVHVNLAMADLMAYLQVVANNSNNLPLTRRDDPEVGRPVFSLTSEEYARKSAAFLPSDVRVIGATFTRYGRVLDLPTSEVRDVKCVYVIETRRFALWIAPRLPILPTTSHTFFLSAGQEYNACDGALEPGRSYGGACCNAMLKVLYDAANDAADAAQTEKASEALFDDDEEDDEDSSVIMGKSFKSGFSLDPTSPNPSTITWADLLRKMKAEMKEIQYAQVPKITTTRKVDLNKPFSLVPPSFDPIKGTKRSLLIGCNYNNVHGAELKACHDDIRSMKVCACLSSTFNCPITPTLFWSNPFSFRNTNSQDYIVNVHGYPETKGLMAVLLDDDDHKHPTFLNITEALKALSEESQPGDAVFVQFSGHGGRILDDRTNSHEQSYDEVIVPSDYTVSGLIRDTLVFKTLLAPMRYGVTVTIMIDCCDNGMVMDLPYSWTARNERKDTLAKVSTSRIESTHNTISVPAQLDLTTARSFSQLSMNEEFSFVRFLKVVRTLYETSAFTQLGKTVGSALAPAPAPKRTRVKKINAEEDLAVKIASPNSISIFDAIDKACHITQSRSSPSSKQNGTISKRQTIASTSLMDQVMSCTLVAPPDEEDWDDDDTFNTRTYDEQSFDTEGRSFESAASATDDDESRKHSRRRRG